MPLWAWITMLCPFVLIIGTLLTMDRPYTMGWLRRRGQYGIRHAVPFDYIAGDGVIALDDNRLQVAWEVEGPDLINLTFAEQAAYVSMMNDAYRRRDESWSLNIEDLRESVLGYPSGDARPDPTTSTMAWARSKRYNTPNRQFRHRRILVATYKPSLGVSGALEKMALDKNARQIETSDEAYQRAVHQFNTGADDVEEGLSAIFKMRRLGAREMVLDGRTVVVDEQLQFLNYCLTGLDHPIIRPPNGDAKRILTSQDMTGGWWPRVGNNWIAVVAIEDMPATSEPGHLDFLADVPVAYRRSTRCVFVDPEIVKRKARGSYYRQKDGATSFLSRAMKGSGVGEGGGMVSKLALENADEAADAADDATRGDVKHVLWSTKIVLMDEDRGRLARTAKDVRAICNKRGFTARIENPNAAEAFVSTIPGDIDHDVSPLLLDTISAIDLSPIATTKTGQSVHPSALFQEVYGRKDVPPLYRMLTFGKNPYDFVAAFNDVQHMLTLGPTGSGKSTWTNTLIAAMRAQYTGAKIFMFDQGRSAERYCLASGGDFYNLDPQQRGIGFCPLMNIDDKQELNWAAEWIIEDLLKPQGVVFNSTRAQKIYRALENLSTQSGRSLSSLQHQLLPIDSEAATALEYFTVTGSMGGLLDSESDGLSNAAFQVFEMEVLMKMRDERAIIPLLHYIFHRIEQRMTDAYPTIIALDEAPEYLQYPTFANRIAYWLDKIRKKNGGVWLATQRINDFMKLPGRISDVVLDSCKTKVYLPNVEAMKSMQQTYLDTGLNVEDTIVIGRAVEKRNVYVVGKDRALLNTDVTPEELLFTAASSPKELQLTAQLQRRYGKFLGRELLRSAGFHEAADMWDRYAIQTGLLDAEPAPVPVASRGELINA